MCFARSILGRGSHRECYGLKVQRCRRSSWQWVEVPRLHRAPWQVGLPMAPNAPTSTGGGGRCQSTVATLPLGLPAAFPLLRPVWRATSDAFSRDAMRCDLIETRRWPQGRLARPWRFRSERRGAPGSEVLPKMPLWSLLTPVWKGTQLRQRSQTPHQPSRVQSSPPTHQSSTTDQISRRAPDLLLD
jgi:hypothetical protein